MSATPRHSAAHHRRAGETRGGARCLVGGVLAVALVALAILVVPPVARADYATGGTGRFQGSLQWISWGAAGTAIPNGGTTTTNTFVIGGETVAVTCSLSNLADIRGGTVPGGSYLTSYRPGGFGGDGLDNLYNVGGVGNANQLVVGLRTQNGRTVEFDYSCGATLNGQPFPLAGLVMADAESTNATESIAATIPSTATWRIIDRYRNETVTACSSNTIRAARTVTGAANRLTLTSSGECNAGSPMAVAFTDGTTSATDVTVAGGGIEAIALGVFVAFDHGDAPASYGDATHAVDYPFTGGEVPGGGGQTAISGTDFTLATSAQPNTRLGAATDPEAAASTSTDASGDDLRLSAGYGSTDDEDAVTPPGTITQLPGSTYTLPGVACTGPGQVAGWIDWNRDGAFDAGERATQQTCTGTTTVALSWTVPTDAVTSTGARNTFLRLRIGPTPASVAAPSGAEVSGEAEDYPLQVVVPVPTVVDDVATTPFETPVTLDPLANDTPAAGTAFVPGTFTLVDPATDTPATTVTTAAGTYAVVPGTTTVEFTPAEGFRGPTPPLPYRISDDLGRPTDGYLGVTVLDPAAPSPEPDLTSTPQGLPVTLDPADNDVPGPTGAPVDPTTLRLLDPLTGDPVTTVTVPGQGTYVVDPATGEVTFTPVPEFTGVASPVAYRVTDANGATGRSSITATVTPVAPAPEPDEVTTPANVPVAVDVLGNDAPGAPGVPLDPTSVVLLDPATGDPVTELVVPGQGTFTVDPTTGAVTFTPLPTFSGPVDPPTYRVTDANGTTSLSSVTVTVADGPAGVPDTVTTPQDAPVTIRPLDDDLPGGEDAPLDPGTTRLVDPGTGLPGSVVTVPDVGTYEVGPDGAVTFTPTPAFTGQAPPLTYVFADVNGAPGSSTLQVTVTPAPPVPDPDVVATAQGRPAELEPVGNDAVGQSGAPLVPSTLRLVATDGTLVTTLTVPREGTYTVDPLTGVVTFDPDPTFTGPGTPVRYSVEDANGAAAVSTITPTVAAAAPAANPDVATTPFRTPVTTSVLANDVPGGEVPLVPGSLRLVDGGGALVTSLVTPAGTYAAGADGTITFTPTDGFTGLAPPVTYSVADANGAVATTTYTVDVTAPSPPVARDDAASTTGTRPVTVSVLGNDTTTGAPLVPASLRLLDPDSGQPVTTVVVPGVGTWVANPDGTITFTPATGYTGTAGIGYLVADVLGRTATAILAVTVPTPVRASPPRRGRLPATGADAALPAHLGGLLLVAGTALVLLGSRRRAG